MRRKSKYSIVILKSIVATSPDLPGAVLLFEGRWQVAAGRLNNETHSHHMIQESRAKVKKLGGPFEATFAKPIPLSAQSSDL